MGGKVRDALIEAARAEFAKQSYAGATTREIARRAGTSEMMLFRHFKTKANLFNEAVFHPFDIYITNFIAREFDEDTPHELSPAAWQRFSSELYQLLEENRALLTTLIAAYNYGQADSSTINYLTSLDNYFGHAAGAFTRTTSEEQRNCLPDSAIVVRLIFGFIASVALFRNWLFPAAIADPGAVTAAMRQLIGAAIGLGRSDDLGPG